MNTSLGSHFTVAYITYILFFLYKQVTSLKTLNNSTEIHYNPNNSKRQAAMTCLKCHGYQDIDQPANELKFPIPSPSPEAIKKFYE